jgi:integrase/recombinase XerD
VTTVGELPVPLLAPDPAPLLPDRNPALLYLARLGPASIRTQRAALERIAGFLSGGRATMSDLPWHRLRLEHAEAIRDQFARQAAPATVNRMLAAFRRVLEEAWRSGLIDVEAYHRAIAVPNVPWAAPPRGRILADDEIRKLFAACLADPTPGGIRDGALLTVLYAAGLRRSELVALDIVEYDWSSRALTVHGTVGTRERTVYATGGAAASLERWIALRGRTPGPLFVPVNKGRKVLVRDQRMSEPSISRVLAKRSEQAGIPACSCQDLRRTFIARLLDSGADIATVQRLAGHCSVNTTRRYDQRSETVRREQGRMLEIPPINPVEESDDRRPAAAR